MRALLIFHMRAGVRIAVRSFAILFSTILAILMLDVNPAGVVKGYAAMIFADRATISGRGMVAALAFLLPALAAPRLAHSLSGWIRHLPFNGTQNRRGMAAALMVTQAPLALGLASLAVVARTLELHIWVPGMALLLILISGALGALPVSRRYLLLPAAAGAALLAIHPDWRHMLIGASLLFGAESISGPLHPPRRRKPWRSIGPFLSFRVAWRALGWRTPAILAIASMPILATALFIRNNDVTRVIAESAARLGAIMAAMLVLAGLANKLAERRPAWPLARSFPWSAGQRIGMDALFLAWHAAIPVIFVAVRYPMSALCSAAALPFVTFRAVNYIRLMPRLLRGERRFLVEGSGIAALVCLLPWTSLAFLAAAPFSFHAARRSERSMKVTGWADLHHAPVGDTHSWSE